MCIDSADLMRLLHESGERMTEALRSYFLSITGAALICAVLQALVPSGTVKKVAGLIAGMIMIVTVLTPLTKLDAATIAQSISQLQMQANVDQSGIEVQNKEIIARIIEQQCTEYIEDKAESLGTSVQVTVVTEQQADYPYPSAVTISGDYSELQRQVLTRYIEENLAIPEQEQVWT